MPSKQYPSSDDKARNLGEILDELTVRLTQSAYTNVAQSFQKLTNFFQQQEQVIAGLQQTIKHLQSENSLLVNENAILKEKLDTLDKRLTGALSAIANLNRNEGGKPKLESIELVERFQQLRGQAFEDIVKKLLEYLRSSDQKEVAKANENAKQKKARIQAILTRYILLEGSKTDNSTVLDNIRTSLGIPENAVGWLEIREKLQELVEKSHQLITAIRNTDPPGHLIGDLFNPDQHEIPPGFKASGRISSIIFPAYYLRGPSVKALVLTESIQLDRFLASEVTELASATESTESLSEVTELASATEKSQIDE
ncbi:MAG TPA: hypothetical protein VEP90_30445 [Methylomirabilota bacterium]|nr:hypothetical protein [Methylomirabilota bacterium]